MKILHEVEAFPTKVNFVDGNGVLLGYDTYNECCSDGGWVLTDTPEVTREIVGAFRMESMDLPYWYFDPTYFKEETPSWTDDGGTAQFRITNSDGEEKFITLYNCHNGYYSKGFTFSSPDAPGRVGSL